MWTLLLVAQLSCADAHFLAIRSESPEVMAFARWCESQAEAARQAEERKAEQVKLPAKSVCIGANPHQTHCATDPLPPKR